MGRAPRTSVSIVGGSGYGGGELLRLLLDHPEVEIQQVTSETYRGKYVYAVHPNLRKRTTLTFCAMDELKPCDLLFLALPHGRAMHRIEQFRELAPRLIDLSADFRLRDAALYPVWYGHEHARPDALGQFVYGIPELHRERLHTARYASGAGCLATATILGLWPLFKAAVVRPDPVVVEAKVGSSAGGNKEHPSTHHPERSGVVRSFEPTGHRHTAEVVQELGGVGERPVVHFSATAVELVRGVLATAHVFLKEPLAERDLWSIYRAAYRDEPFMRIVKEKTGTYRYPEPKILTGSNYCDVGFEVDPHSNRVVVMAALDNLVKGAAGNAVQAMNVMHGFEETAGLGFSGLHPV
jgi:LysW-gamma-L-alpha-aminoadipyl-6-phosphate/LysW-L-glutamyl-5-phosphate reductase